MTCQRTKLAPRGREPSRRRHEVTADIIGWTVLVAQSSYCYKVGMFTCSPNRHDG